jgi:putative heme-binding domain-containing protein
MGRFANRLKRQAVLLNLAGGVLLAQAPGQNIADFEQGARLFAGSCAVCHGAGGDAVQGIDFGRGKFKRVVSDEDLGRFISKGIPGTAMPPFDFRPREMALLVDYLRAIRQSRVDTPEGGDAALGKALFEGKGGCPGCHRVNGKGSRVGPDLSDIGAIRPASALEQSILDPDAVILPEHLFCRAVTRDGVTITGRRLNEDPNTVQLIDTGERLVSLNKADLREYTLLKTSPMPSYRGKLSPAAVRDLVRYLSTLRGLDTP